MKFGTLTFALIISLTIVGFDTGNYANITQGYYNKLIGHINNIILIEGNKIKRYGLGDTQIILSQGFFQIKSDTLLIEVIDWYKYSGKYAEPDKLPKIDTIILTLGAEHKGSILKGYDFRGYDEDLKAYVKKRVRGVRTRTYRP
ncbi:MAG: hypothetical protein JNM78_06325 [Cyclobacteriaceae bacterium]|nr:hypothetical protein [Cyclobacteriaceae bacterium]